MYTEDFLIRPRQLAESADKVIRISKRAYNPKNVKLFINGIDISSMLSKNWPVTLHYLKRTELLQSKSKQSRIVSVVCK